MAEKFDLSVILRFIDKSAAGMVGFQKRMKNVGTAMKNVGTEMRNKISLPIALAAANAIRMGADFQKTMNMVGAVTGTTGKEFDSLKLLARDLGATTQFSARQAGEAMKFMGMAGFDANKIISASPKVLQLAAAAQLDMGTAADITTNIMSGFGFQAKDMARVNDILVNTFTNSNVSLSQLGEALKKAGPVAKSAGLSFTELTAALGTLGSAGIQGSEAGVALRRAFINLQAPSKAAQKQMAFLELNLKKSDGRIKSITGVLEEFENALAKGATQVQIDTALIEIFGARALAPMQVLLASGSSKLSIFEEKLKKSGTAAKIAKRQTEGLPGALNKLKSAWESVNIALTEGEFGKWVEDVVRGFADIMSSISTFIKTQPELAKWGVAVAGIFAVTGPLLIGLGLAAVAIGALTLPILLVSGAIVAIAAAIALMSAAKSTIKGPVTRENVSQFGGLGAAAGSFIPKSEVLIKVQAEPGTSSAIGGIKTKGGAKVGVENKSDVGPTMPNLTSFAFP